jgi:hypothetical protein
MRCEWVLILGAGLCIGTVPGCSPLLWQPSADELPVAPTAQRQQPAAPAPAGVTPAASHASALATDIIKPAAVEPMAEAARYPALVTDPDIIPPVAEPSVAPTVTPPVEQNPEPRSQPESKAKMAEDPALLEAFRCFLNKQPDEAVRWLARCDKQSQELLLCLLPLAVRLSEGGWEHCDPREASSLVQQLDRVTDLVAAPLRCRAPLKIKKMCFCDERGTEGYGKYNPLPDSHGYRPGDFAHVYVEFQNLSDQPYGNHYRIQLAGTAVIRDPNAKKGYLFLHDFHDSSPDISRAQRHDFYRIYHFCVPDDIHPGLYVLYLTVTDIATGRTATHTLDLRITAPSEKAYW